MSNDDYRRDLKGEGMARQGRRLLPIGSVFSVFGKRLVAVIAGRMAADRTAKAECSKKISPPDPEKAQCRQPCEEARNSAMEEQRGSRRRRTPERWL